MKRKIYLSLLACLSFAFAWSQDRQVSGRVLSDSSRSGVGGVSVTVKGTKTITTTNNEGRYSIAVPQTNATLVFSYVGYRRQEVSVGTRSSVDITLQEEPSSLNDIVVIGYGTARKKDVTGATSSISGRDLEKIPVASAAEAITGRLPGVQVTTTDGQPGADIVIRVRGGGSITGDNSPLYVVDGFQVSSISDIPPTDIASIDVLKDASSTAIYGARGANGVIIVTTKSARGGKTNISFNSFLQARTLPRKLEVLSPYEFALAQYEYAKIRSQSDVDNFTKYYGVYDDLELYKNQRGTDWQEKLFGGTTLSQQHSLSITGGSDKTRMGLSVSNNKEEGLQPGSGYNRTYLNYKMNHDISNKLKLDLNSRFTNTVVRGAGTGGNSSVRIGDAITTRPVNGLADQIVIDPNGGTSDEEYDQFLRSLMDPLKITEQDYRRNTTNAINTNIGVSWSIIPSLIARSEFGFDMSWANNKRYYGPLTGEARTNGNSLPVAEIRDGRRTRYRSTNTLTYTKKSGSDHDLNMMAGHEVYYGRVYSEYTRAENFAENLSPDRIFNNIALGVFDQFATADFHNANILSFFGRVNYQFKNKYLLTLTGRYDGSARFAPGKQWAFFPAASVAWRVSQEDFMKDVAFVSDLKFRLSYGSSGNDNIGGDLFRRTFSIQTNRPIGFADVNQPYWAPASNILVNPDLKWETTITRNAGLDFTLFRGRLSGALDIYQNTVKGLLVESIIPSSTGYDRQQRNIGQTSNRGIELGLTGTIVNKKDFTLNANFNIGLNRARIDKLDGVNERPFSSNWAGTDLRSQDDYRAIVGQTLGLMYGFVTDGFYTTADFSSFDPVTRKYILKAGVPDASTLLGTIGGSLSASGLVRPGTLKLKDKLTVDTNGDGVPDQGDGVITADDREIIGSAQADFSGGFGLNATYKNFDISTFFNYVVGNDVYNTGRISFNMLYRTTFGNMLNTMNYENRYKYIDANGNLVTELADLEKLNANATIWSPFSTGTATPVFHSYAVEDGSFLRLNNVTLGYSLPKSLISRLRMTRLRVYATVYNAFLWTKYSGYDPEVSQTRNGYNALTPGVDYSGYPKSRTFSAGLNVTF